MKRQNKEKKKQKRKIKFSAGLLGRMFVGLIVMVAVALTPTLYFATRNIVQEKYGQKLAGYQGVVELWNIDSFEGGTASKSGFLSARAIEYQALNKGFYVMVRQFTEEECIIALQAGQRPAMFSFGVGVASELIDYLASVSVPSQNNLRSEFLVAAKVGGNQLALPWCRGMYSLISTVDNLAAAGVSEADLSKVALECGYVKTISSRKTRTVYSLAFGGSGYICPQAAFASLCGNMVQTELSFDGDYGQKTGYNAYCDFVEGKSSILLGTQRDMARVENRISQGKMDNVIYQHLSGYCDLVQYIAICTSAQGNIKSQCQDFCNFLTSANVQNKLSNIGMFSVASLNNPLYTEGQFAVAELAASSSCIVPNLFFSKDEIAVTKMQYITPIKA